MTPTDICNIALSRLGQAAINDIGEHSRDAIACRAHFESVRDALLRSHSWGFATGRAELSRTDSPVFGWPYAYALPADFLRLNTFNGALVDLCNDAYEIEGKKLLTDAEIARVTYVKRVTDTNEFDASFVEAFALKLAEAIAIAVTGMPDKMADMAALASRRFEEASFHDATESRASMADPLGGSFASYARGGGVCGDEIQRPGATGANGWSPIYALVSRDDDQVIQLVSWYGGTGTAPTLLGYVGAAGIVEDIADAVAIVGSGGGGSMTAAEILAELLTVDGAGSGLDADLLDGNSSAAFATAANLTSHTDATTGAHGMTAFGASLVDDSSASAARTTLGLVIGTNVLGYDTALNRTGSGDQTFITQQGNTVLRTAFSGASLYTPYAFVADGGLTFGQILDQKFTRGGTNLVHLTDGYSGYAQLRLGGIKLTPIAISALPTASASEGWRYEVNDANTPVVGVTVASGGSAKCEVRSNGTDWKVLQVF